MRRRSRAALGALAATAALLGALGGSTAEAAPFVDVTYDLGDSSAISTVVTAIQDFATLSPPQLSGTMKIRYASDSVSGLLPGPSTLLAFNLSVRATVGLTYATIGGGTASAVINTGTLRFHLKSPVPGGTLLPGGTVDPLGGIGQLRLTGTIHCYLLCGAISAPASTPVPIATVSNNFNAPSGHTSFSQPLGPLYGASGTPHTVMGTQYATFVFEVYNNSGSAVKVVATTFIVGREVLREPVPEPSTLPLLGVGVLGLGAVALRRHRMRARS